MLVYLDSNVLIEVCDGRAPGLDSLLRQAVAAGIHSYPFSAEQVSEITFGRDAERNKARLSFLSQLSGDLYFVRSVYDYGFRTESPFSVYATLKEVPLDQSLERDFAQMVSYEDQRRARKEFGLDPVELNNLSPREAINRIEGALAAYQYDAPAGVEPPRSLAAFLQYGEANIKENFADLWAQMGVDPEHMLLDHKIVSLFSLFDSLGFWSDDRVVYEKGSRFADSRHAFNASHFSLPVSRDKRFLNKAAAVYEYLGLGVVVQSTETFEQSLLQGLGSPCRI